MFLDSCVINELHKDPKIKELIEIAGQYYSTYTAAVSMLEVGFGPTNKSDVNQRKAALEMYIGENIQKVSANNVDQLDPLHTRRPGTTFLYIPSEHDWYGARHKLIRWMDSEGAGGNAARKQANDALIYSCAWNANSFLVTENLKDFNRLNRIMLKESGGQLPIFTINDLKRALNEEVTFPENIDNFQ